STKTFQWKASLRPIADYIFLSSSASETPPTHWIDMGQLNDPLASEYQQRLERAIAGYLDDVAQGKPPDADELIAAHPDLAEDLRRFLENHQRIMHVAQSSRANDEIGSG